MRWKTVVVGLALGVAVTAGCNQQCFITEPDLDHYRQIMPAGLETNPAASLIPPTSTIPAPGTVLNPERPRRYLSLSEAIALALENGSVGSPLLNGISNFNLASFTGRGIAPPEVGIRVLALDPAIVGADIEASLSKFDARWDTQLNWMNTDQPVGATVAFGNLVQSFQNGILATAQTSLLKPLPTGGVAGITFRTTYTDLSQPPPGIVNPIYRPTLQFQFEQPLLNGFGVEINQLRSTHPGSVLTPFPTGGRVEGILITRLRFDEARAEFERNLNTMLINVEVAYWNLYGAYWNLYSREQALRQSFEAWKINKERFDAGRISVEDVAQTRGQYELFRAQRIQALQQVLDNERFLRMLIGLPVEDGTQLTPTDTPTLAPYQPDWSTSLNEALALRPELLLAREELKFRQLDLINQKNLLLPDVRFTATYDINGIGQHLDGGPRDPNNAFSSLASDKFNDWQLGLRADIPLGYRDAHSAVRAAKLNLARSYALLKDQERRTAQFLASEYTNIVQFYEVSRAQRSQREAAAIQLDARYKQFLAGRGTLDFLLEAQRVWADALRDEFNAIVQYNNALATFEFAKGTLLQHDNVIVAEGLLPHAAQVRAVDHENERTKALVVAERAKPILVPLKDIDGHKILGVPQLPDATAPAVPALEAGQEQLPKLPEALPAPREVKPETTPDQGPAIQPMTYSTSPARPVAITAPAAAKAASLGEPQGVTLTNPPDQGEYYHYRPQNLTR
jgi:outer membrane protein TolC